MKDERRENYDQDLLYVDDKMNDSDYCENDASGTPDPGN
jgi:hypothetical protein